jgi:hypothetical protein
MNDRVKAYNDQFRKPILRTTRAPSNSPRVCKFEIQVPLDANAEQRATFAAWVQQQCVPAFFEPLGLRLGPK